MSDTTVKTGALAGRAALITGASRGVGAAVAKRFAAEGAHVILLARTVGGLEEVDDAIKAAGGRATLVPCDLTEFERIDTLGPALLERFDKLDILVGNAGALGEMTPLTHYDAKAWHEVFDVNVHANWRLIRTLDPLLRRSDAGRAIMVTSRAASNPRAFWGPRQHWKRWCMSGRRNWWTRTCASICSTPVPRGPACALRHFQGKTPKRSKHPRTSPGRSWNWHHRIAIGMAS
jgi:NAD(P)-dependent dehydrogenase (short-subunit alcohol dehydrogenase family)